MKGYAIAALVIIPIFLIIMSLFIKDALVYHEINSFIFDYKFGFDNCSVNKSIYYSLESSLYPYILFAIVISTAGLFFITVFVLFLESIGYIKILKKKKILTL